MKVTGPSPSGVSATQGPRAKAAEGGFSLGSTASAQASAPAARASEAAPLATLDALLALQEAPSPTDRRKRAVKRAGKILDHLDALKLTLLDSSAPDSVLLALAAAVKEAREDTSDPGLEAVLNEIETRAAVELAKREVRSRSF